MIAIYLQASAKIAYLALLEDIAARAFRRGHIFRGRHNMLAESDESLISRSQLLRVFAAAMLFPGTASKSSDTPLTPNTFSCSSPVSHEFSDYRLISEGNSRSGWDFATF